MFESRLLNDYLNDILEAIHDIREFTAGMNLEGFLKDKKTINAVVRCLEIIGEAANKIPPAVQSKYSEAAWPEIIGMRNKLIHEYFGVDLGIVWQTIHDDLEPFEKVILVISAELTP